MAMPKSPPMPPAMAACACRSRTPLPSTPGCKPGRRSMSTTRTGAGVPRCAATPGLDKAPPVMAGLHPHAEHSRDVAEAEAVDEQREQQLDAVDGPFALRPRDHPSEGGGEFVGGFVERFVEGAFLCGSMLRHGVPTRGF